VKQKNIFKKVEFHKSPAGGGVWRVNGDLAMSRSFGDPNVKKVISADPDVVVKSGMAEIDAVVIARLFVVHIVCFCCLFVVCLLFVWCFYCLFVI
jgi:hypothetical protein